MKLAIVGRLIAVLIVGFWIFASRDSQNTPFLGYGAAFIGYAAVGFCHYLLIGSRYDQLWLKYLVVSVDIGVLSVLMATQPMVIGVEVPQSLAFKNDTFPLYYIILALAAFSLSPWLILWTGLAGAGGWLAAFHWAIRDMPDRLEWADIGSSPTTEHFLNIFLDPNFANTGGRIQQAIYLSVCAILLAIVIHRARQAVLKQLALDEERRAISDVFGRFVPREVADALIDDRGALAPVEREATILFLDIAGFTAMTERLGPRGVVDVLNRYFDDAARIIADHGGVITQFQGDAVLAMFNLPVEKPDHAAKALDAALDLQAMTARDHAVTVRIGVSTGQAFAGNIGGGGRQTYSVHGDTVNLAARLEGLNKRFETGILVSESTMRALTPERAAAMTRVGEITVRGLSQPVGLYTPQPDAAIGAAGDPP